MNKKYNFLPICFLCICIYIQHTQIHTHICIVYAIIITYKLINISTWFYGYNKALWLCCYICYDLFWFLFLLNQILLALVTGVIWPLPSTLFSWPSSVFSTEFTQSHFECSPDLLIPCSCLWGTSLLSSYVRNDYKFCCSLHFITLLLKIKKKCLQFLKAQ